MPAATYHASPGYGSTTIRLAAQWSVAHALQAQAQQATPAMRMGSLIHAAVLEPERLGVDVVVAEEAACEGRDGKRCTRAAVLGASHCWQHGGREEAEEWRATLAPGADVVSPTEMEALQRASEGIRAAVGRTVLGRLLEGGEREVSILGVAEDVTPTVAPIRVAGEADESALIVRGRIDLLHDGVACDLKTVTTTAALGARRMTYRLDDYGMAIQAALYLRLADAACERSHAWLWLVAEQGPPYGVRIYEPHMDDLARAGDEVDEALWHLSEYRRTGDAWVGWPSRTEIIARPRRWDAEEE
jgi:hypothetical protein